MYRQIMKGLVKVGFKYGSIKKCMDWRQAGVNGSSLPCISVKISIVSNDMRPKALSSRCSNHEFIFVITLKLYFLDNALSLAIFLMKSIEAQIPASTFPSALTSCVDSPTIDSFSFAKLV